MPAPSGSREGSQIEHEFRELFRDLAPQVRGWAARQYGGDLADDVVNETFVVVWRRWESIPPEPGPRRAWVYTVARYKAAHLRAAASRAPVPVVDLERAGVSEPDVSDGVIASHAAKDVLARLSPADREVLFLVAVHGFTPADAAEVLGCSMTAMTTRLSRARARLAAQMNTAQRDTAQPDTADLGAADTADLDAAEVAHR